MLKNCITSSKAVYKYLLYNLLCGKKSEPDFLPTRFFCYFITFISSDISAVFYFTLQAISHEISHCRYVSFGNASIHSLIHEFFLNYIA